MVHFATKLIKSSGKLSYNYALKALTEDSLS